MLKVYALFAQIFYGEIMKKLFVITCLFFLVACNMKGYNSTTNKFSDEELLLIYQIYDKIIESNEFRLLKLLYETLPKDIFIKKNKKQIIKSNKRIDIQQSQSEIEKLNLNKQIELANNNVNLFFENKLAVSDVFDINSLAKYFSILE